MIVPNQQVEYVCPIDKKLKKATIPSQIKIGNVTYKVTAIGAMHLRNARILQVLQLKRTLAK